MKSDRTRQKPPLWLPLSLGACAVLTLTLGFTWPALAEARRADHACYEFFDVTKALRNVDRSIEHLRSERERLWREVQSREPVIPPELASRVIWATPPVGDEGQPTCSVIFDGTFEEMLDVFAAVDAAPGFSVKTMTLAPIETETGATSQRLRLALQLEKAALPATTARVLHRLTPEASE